MTKRKRFKRMLKKINVTHEDDRKVLDKSLDHLTYKRRNIDQEFDERHIRRVMVNHIRHCNTKYDSLLSNCDIYDLYNYCDHPSYWLIRNRTLEVISQAYPYLDNECRYQSIPIL